MKKIRQSLILACILLAASCSSLSSSISGSLSTDPDMLARQATDAMGGRRAFDKARFFAWKSGTRSYVWDKETGRCRAESREGGDLILTLLNVKTGEGAAVRNNAVLPPAEAAPMLRQAADRFASDSFWLFNIMRTLDPGARRSYAGEQEIDGRKYEVLQASFEGKPDLYWFYIDPETHLPHAWTVALNGRRGVPVTYLYARMQTIGDLTFPAEYVQEGTGRKIAVDNLQILGSVDDSVFTGP